MHFLYKYGRLFQVSSESESLVLWRHKSRVVVLHEKEIRLTLINITQCLLKCSSSMKNFEEPISGLSPQCVVFSKYLCTGSPHGKLKVDFFSVTDPPELEHNADTIQVWKMTATAVNGGTPAPPGGSGGGASAGSERSASAATPDASSSNNRLSPNISVNLVHHLHPNVSQISSAWLASK